MERTPAAHRAAARLSVFGAAFFWGTSATLARHLFRDWHVSPFTVVELRLATASVLLAGWLALRDRRALVVRREDWGYFLSLGLFGIAALQGSYYYAISVLGVSLAILLQYLAPSLLVLRDLARGRRVSRTTLGSVIAALAGLVLLVGQVHPATLGARWWHWAVGLGSALLFAFYIVHSKRGLARYSPPTVLLWTFVVAAVAWMFVTPPWAIAARGYPLRVWGMFAALGVFSTLVPFVLFYRGLRRLSAAETGILVTLEPVIAVLSAALLLGERLVPLQWLGAALVLGASALASREEPEAVEAQAERG